MNAENLPLSKLVPERLRSLKLLLLARFAPDPGTDAPPDMHPTGGVFPRYHHELYRILSGLGIDTTPCRDIDRFFETARDYNFVFSVFNRIPPKRNAEVLVSSVCEYLGIPYLGAPPNIRALAEDKYLTKRVARSLGIPVLPGKAYRHLSETETPPDFGGPYFVKPRFGAASEDIDEASFQDGWSGAKAKVVAMVERGKECLVEQGVIGTDITVPALGGTPPLVLPCAEEISELKAGVSTFRQKRMFEAKRRRIIIQDRPEDRKLCRALQAAARTLCDEIRRFDYLRVDFRLDARRERFYLLECNICCNLASYAAVSQSAAHVGISQPELIGHILAHSLARQSKVAAPKAERLEKDAP